MLKEEAKFIGNEIKIILKEKKIKSVLDIGSSTLEFRTITQPFIQQEIFDLLERNRINVIHLDQKKAKGVDLVCDIDKLNNLEEKYDLVLCFNLLEHVKNPKETIKNIERLVEKKGTLIITVPYCYPYHPDPIDNLFRPRPQELASLFTHCQLINSQVQKGSWKRKNRLLVFSFSRLAIDFKWNFFFNNLMTFLKGPQVTIINLNKKD
jgi:SAM-dependent methyltransferase